MLFLILSRAVLLPFSASQRVAAGWGFAVALASPEAEFCFLACRGLKTRMGTLQKCRPLLLPFRASN